MSAASGHGSAFEESLKDDSDHESLSSATSPATTGRIKEDAAKDGAEDPVLNMPGSFGQSHGLLQEPESPLPTVPSSTTTHQDDIDFPVDTVFPVVHEDSNKRDRSPVVDAATRSRRRSGMLMSINVSTMAGFVHVLGLNPFWSSLPALYSRGPV